MLKTEDYVLAYAKKIYGAQILYRNRAVYIKTEDDLYRIDMRLADKNIYRFRSMTRPIVLVEDCLARGFFRLAAHSTYKEMGAIPTNTDWERFLNDAYRYFVEEQC